jgi:hypothetical protein
VNLRALNPKGEAERVSGDCLATSQTLIRWTAWALPYAGRATSTYGGVEVFRSEVTGNPRQMFNRSTTAL